VLSLFRHVFFSFFLSFRFGWAYFFSSSYSVTKAGDKIHSQLETGALFRVANLEERQLHV